MRLIQLQLNEKVVTYLVNHIANELRFPNPGLVIDIFCMLRRKGKGIPTDDVVNQLVDHFVTTNGTDKFMTALLLKKQRHVLVMLEKSVLFRAMCNASDPIKATRQVLEYSINTMFKVSKAYCAQCQLNNACGFYTHFRDISDISMIAGDSHLLSQVHDDCPRRPIIDMEDMISKGSELLAKLMKLKSPKQAKTADTLAQQPSQPPDDGGIDLSGLDDGAEGGSVSASDLAVHMHEIDEDGYVSAGKGNAIPQYSMQKLVGYLEGIGNQLAKEDVDIFALGQTFEDAFNSSMRKDMFKNTDALGQRRITDTSHKHSDLLKGKPEDLIHDDDVIDRKVAQGDLRIKQEQEQRAKKVYIYVLVDVSYSMDDPVVGHINRLVVAKTLLFAMLEKLKRDNAVFICRAFSDNIGERVYAETEEEYAYAYERLVKGLIPKGGTDINNALSVAMREIVDAKDSVADAEILLITDSEDRFSKLQYDNMKQILSKWPESILHVIKASPTPKGQRNATLADYLTRANHRSNDYPAELVLKDVAKRFVSIEVTNGQLNIDSILNTITL